jgi:Na+/proline symporter
MIKSLCINLLLVTIGLFVVAGIFSILPSLASTLSVNNANSNGDYSEVINSILTMLGGGGIGAASSSLINHKRTPETSIDISASGLSSNFTFSPAYLKEQIDLLKKANQETRRYCKRLRNREGYIEDFLIKKYSQEYERYVERIDKDTIT